jgi:hypothetical protein
MKFRKIFISSCLIITSLNFSKAQYNLPHNQWMLKKILEAPSGNNPIYSQFYRNEQFLFWPEDLLLKENKYNSNPEEFIKINNKLYHPIIGTGRVYEIKLKKNSVIFERIDSTIYFGYNFGAFYFNHQDTLFSLGGYGTWHFSGTLRYFHPTNRDWEAKDINYHLPITGRLNGVFIDYPQHRIFMLNNHNRDQDLKPNAMLPPDTDPFDTLNFFQLDLRSYNWKKLGKPTNFAKYLIKDTYKTGIIPFGEIYISPKKNDQNIYILNYSENRIFQLKNIEDIAMIKRVFLFNNELDPISRIATYYNSNDSTFNILTSQKKHYRIPLRRQNLKVMNEKVYEFVNFNLLSYFLEPFHLSLLLNVLMIGAGLFYFYKRNKKKIVRTAKPLPKFDEQEKDILLFIFESPDHAVNLFEIDYRLGTTGKSLDTQSKRRSSIMRSINEKYSILSGDTDPLITTKRVLGDRRMFSYILNPGKFEAIRNQL